MSDRNHGARDYLLGHSDDELQRLERQGDLFSEPTNDVLRRAGIRPGMRVLDLGCGAGDVTLALARMVGPSGSVAGIDTSADAIAKANARLSAAGLHHAVCREAGVMDVDAAGYDAVVGRFILMHLPDRLTLLRRLKETAAPGTVVVFIEMDISSSAMVPPAPIFDDAVAAICAVYRLRGAEPDMGSRLFGAFRDAGFEPALRGSCRVEGGVLGAPVFEYLAQSVAALAPAMRQAGVLPATVDPATFRSELAAAANATDRCVCYPRLVGAWAIS